MNPAVVGKLGGQVRVGSCHWVGGKRVDPTYLGFTSIVCLTQSSPYGMLGPYCLTVRKKFSDGEVRDVIFENYFQYSKIYERVPEVVEVRSRFDRTVIWKWPAEVHCLPVHTPDPANSYWSLQPAYLKWRDEGMKVKDPIRYPVGKRNMGKCLFALADNPDGTINPKMLSYVEGRTEIYLKEYVKLVKQHPEFVKLQHRLAAGENLLIIEVDCCQERSLPYYIQTYGIADDFIHNGTMLVTQANLNLMLNDTTERFGHGYCLAGALAGYY